MRASADPVPWEDVIDQGRWVPVFQPIVSLTAGHILAYEALSRPHDRDGHPVSVLQVVEKAHAAGAEARVDTVAIQSIGSRAYDLPAGSMLFVNASPATLLDHVEALAPLRGLEGRLVIELTERDLVPEERMAEFQRVIGGLRGKGVLVAMDDCGAGYSGLTRLVRLRPDFAKIDMELVRGVDEDGAKAALVDAFVHFAREAGITVIAEGIETVAERDALSDLGVEYIQGFLVGRPEPTFARVDPKIVLGTRSARPSVEPRTALAATIRIASMAAHGLGDQVGLYEAVVQAARQATGADLAVLRRRTDETLVPVARSGPPVAPMLTSGRTSDVSVRAVRDGRTSVRQTFAQGPTNSRFGSVVSAPVWRSGDVWGVLAIGYEAENRVRADLVQVITGLADQVSLVLRSSGAHDAGRARDVLEAMRYMADHPGDWTDLWSRVLRNVEIETDAHDCWLGLIQGLTFRVVTSAGEVVAEPVADWMSKDTLRGRMPPGIALREGRTVVVDDIRQELSLASELDGLLARAIISAVAVPVFAGDRVRGILKAYHSASGAFTEDRVAYLEGVAALIGRLIDLRRPGGSTHPDGHPARPPDTDTHA